jgi:hypothetical protein
MKKLLLVLATLFAASLAPTASAQTPVYNCTAGCQIVSQVYLVTDIQPKTCKLWRGSTLLLTAPAVPGANVVDSTAPVPPAGSVGCTFAVTLPVGTWTYTMTAVSIDGFESPQSAVFTFRSSRGAPAAPVVRIRM